MIDPIPIDLIKTMMESVPNRDNSLVFKTIPFLQRCMEYNCYISLSDLNDELYCIFVHIDQSLIESFIEPYHSTFETENELDIVYELNDLSFKVLICGSPESLYDPVKLINIKSHNKNHTDDDIVLKCSHNGIFDYGALCKMNQLPYLGNCFHNKVAEVLYSPSQIEKWLNAGNELEDYIRCYD